MKTQVTVHEKLRNLRLEHGLTLEQLAEAVNISKSTLASYESNEYKDISHTSLIALAKFYGVSTDYLLGIAENRELQNVKLSSLHLSDDMLALLQSGSINHRLLCELVTHPAFPAMLADIEIYVDGIANIQIQNLNSVVDFMRQKILERFLKDSTPKRKMPPSKRYQPRTSIRTSISAMSFSAISPRSSAISALRTRRMMILLQRNPLWMSLKRI